MTQSNSNSPPPAAGGNDPKKHEKPAIASPSAAAPKSAPPVAPTKKNPAATVAASSTPATPSRSDTAPQSDKSRADAWNAGGSRSPGSLPKQMTEVECCDPKSASSGDKTHSHAAPIPIPANAKTSEHGTSAPTTVKSAPKLGVNEPIQPNRPATIRPKRVDEPIVGASGSPGGTGEAD